MVIFQQKFSLTLVGQPIGVNLCFSLGQGYMVCYDAERLITSPKSVHSIGLSTLHLIHISLLVLHHLQLKVLCLAPWSIIQIFSSSLNLLIFVLFLPHQEYDIRFHYYRWAFCFFSLPFNVSVLGFLYPSMILCFSIFISIIVFLYVEFIIILLPLLIISFNRAWNG